MISQQLGTSRQPGPLGFGALQPRHNTEGMIGTASRTGNSATTIANRVGKIPERDGEINTYMVSPSAWKILVERNGQVSAVLKVRPPRLQTSGPVLYVNGIKATRAKARQQALMTSAFSGGPVEGIFNESDGMVMDFLQCINDKRTSADYMSFKGAIGKFVDGLTSKLGFETEFARMAVESSIEDNPATMALFHKLLDPAYRYATVVAHSQGTIIACNALNAVAAVLGSQAIDGMRVISIGSPVVFWSQVKNVHSFGFKNDAIALMSFSVGSTRAYAGLLPKEEADTEEPINLSNTSDISQKLTHTFYLYVAHYWNQLVSLFP